MLYHVHKVCFILSRTSHVRLFSLVCDFIKVSLEFHPLNTRNTTLIRKKIIVLFFSLQRFKDNGMLNRLKHQYSTKPNPAGTNHNEVTLGGIAPLLLILVGGIFLAFVILIVEKTYSSLDNLIKKWGTVNSRNPRMLTCSNASEKKILTRRKPQISVKWKGSGFNTFVGYYP